MAENVLRDLRLDVRDGVAVVDLRRVRFVRPAHIVGVAARAHLARKDGQPFRLVGPLRRDPSGYAARMQLGSMLDSLGAEHDLPAAAGRERSGLLEVSLIDTPARVRSLARVVFRAVAGADETLAAALHESLGELGANVRDHSATVGFACAQVMPSLDELRFAVADSGLGLWHTLARKGATGDAAALELALDGVSRFDDPDRGGGLRTTVGLVSELAGSTLVATGAATVRDGGAGRSFADTSHRFSGTLVEAVIPVGPGPHARLLGE